MSETEYLQKNQTENIMCYLTKSEKEMPKRSLERIIKNFHFLKKIHNHLIKEQSFSSKMNVKSFEEMYKKFEIGFVSFFGKIPYQELFNLLDEDNDMYLNEDEQLLIFSTINAKLFFLYEEFIFLGIYDYIPKLENVRKLILELLSSLHGVLRENLYQEQIEKFEKIKNGNLGRERNKFNLRMTDFQKFRNNKMEELKKREINYKLNTINDLKFKLGKNKFGKYSQMKEMMIQEKFLSIYGNIEESKNMKKIYEKFFQNELEKMEKIKKKTHNQFLNSLKKRSNFLQEILNLKMDSEKKKIDLQNNHLQTILESKLSARKNRLKKIQDQMNARAVFSCVKENSVNQLRSNSRLKKDFLFQIKNSSINSEQKKIFHSNVFQTYFSNSHRKTEKNDDQPFLHKDYQNTKTLNFTNYEKMNYKNFLNSSPIENLNSKEEEIKLLKLYINSDFNIRFHLRKGNKEFEAINQQIKSKNKDIKDIEKIKNILSQNNIDDNKNFRLCHLYNDDLELKQDKFLAID